MTNSPTSPVCNKNILTITQTEVNTSTADDSMTQASNTHAVSPLVQSSDAENIKITPDTHESCSTNDEPEIREIVTCLSKSSNDLPSSDSLSDFKINGKRDNCDEPNYNSSSVAIVDSLQSLSDNKPNDSNTCDVVSENKDSSKTNNSSTNPIEQTDIERKKSIKTEKCDIKMGYTGIGTTNGKCVSLDSSINSDSLATANQQITEGAKILSELQSGCSTDRRVYQEGKKNSAPEKYNPFIDPQILLAADGLELLSTLAEQRAKCIDVSENKSECKLEDKIEESALFDSRAEIIPKEEINSEKSSLNGNGDYHIISETKIIPDTAKSCGIKSDIISPKPKLSIKEQNTNESSQPRKRAYSRTRSIPPLNDIKQEPTSYYTSTGLRIPQGKYYAVKVNGVDFLFLGVVC